MNASTHGILFAADSNSRSRLERKRLGLDDGWRATFAAIRERLLREARAMARLRSPHAVQLLGVSVHEPVMDLAMDLLEGETLAERLARARRFDARLTFTLLK